MSRIGKRPVMVPDGVDVQLNGRDFTAKGKLGTLAMRFLPEVNVTVEEASDSKRVVLTPITQSKQARSIWGMQRTLVSNIINGVTSGFSRSLDMTGVGYRAQVKGDMLNLQLGFSHDVNLPIPEGIKIETPSQTSIIVSGIDKQLVGQVASEIRSYRKPEPYNGKGIRYQGEYVFRKEGKKK